MTDRSHVASTSGRRSMFPLSFRLYSQRGAEVEWKAYVSGNQLVIGLRWWLVTVTWRAVLDA